MRKFVCRSTENCNLLQQLERGQQRIWDTSFTMKDIEIIQLIIEGKIVARMGTDEINVLATKYWTMYRTIRYIVTDTLQGAMVNKIINKIK